MVDFIFGILLNILFLLILGLLFRYPISWIIGWFAQRDINKIRKKNKLTSEQELDDFIKS